MKFLIVKQDSTAEIYGHTYNLRSMDNPNADLQDILVADNGSASELLRRHEDICATADIRCDREKNFPKPLKTPDDVPPNSNILLLRSGGIGDHVMLLPALKALKEKFSHRSIQIWISVQEEMSAIFQDSPDINRVYPLPITLHDMLHSDYFVDFSHIIDSSCFNEKHPTDYYLDVLGIDQAVVDDKQPALNPRTARRPIINELLKILRDEHENRPLVLLHWLASVHLRTLPPEKFREITNEFKDYVFIVAHHYTQAERSYATEKKSGLKAINISSYIRDLNDFISVVSAVAGVVSTDTSAYHIAAALNKPALVFFGAIDSGLRTCYYPDVISVDAAYKGNKCCSPCNLHKGACPEALHLGTPYSPCLMSISEKDIYENFKTFAERYLQES